MEEDSSAVKALPYEWRPISRGDSLPSGAVMAGSTATDGEVYVGRNAHGVGKLNLKESKWPGTMWNIWVHGGGATTKGDVLISNSGDIRWVEVWNGDRIPDNAVEAGNTSTDGLVYPCRTKDGEAGKLNTDKGRVCKMWYHNHWRGKTEAEILCISATDPEPEAVKTGEAASAGEAALAGAAGYSLPTAHPSDKAAPPKAAPLPSAAQRPFNHVGSNIELSNGNCTATRVVSINYGICIGKDPLAPHPDGRYYELRIDAKYKSPRALAVGIITKPAAETANAEDILNCEGARGNFQHLPATWLIGYDHGGALFCNDGTESKIPDAAWRPVKCVQEGSLIGVLWADSVDPPELVVFQDGVERVRLPAAGRLPKRDEELFAIVDLQGCVSQTTLLHGEPPKSQPEKSSGT